MLSGSGEILTGVTNFVSSAASWIGDFCEAIVSNELLLVGVVIMPIAGFGIGAIRRLLSNRV